MHLKKIRLPFARRMLILSGKAMFLLITFAIFWIQIYHQCQISQGVQRPNQTEVNMVAKQNEKYSFERKDVICLDEFSQPIFREEVLLTKHAKVKEKTFLTIGIPTIVRSMNGESAFYLTTTLHEILNQLSTNETDEIRIVVFCADQDESKRTWIRLKIENEFSDHIRKGTIEIIHAPKRFYRRIEGLPRTFHDSEMRVKWRSKQSLDYSFMFYYVAGLSDYYLQLEDDLKIENGFYKTLKDDVVDSEINSKKWNVLTYYYMGFIGKLMKSRILIIMADYLRLFYYEQPPDWLYDMVLEYLELSGMEEHGSRVLFQHIGNQSSSKNT